MLVSERDWLARGRDQYPARADQHLKIEQLNARGRLEMAKQSLEALKAGADDRSLLEEMPVADMVELANAYDQQATRLGCSREEAADARHLGVPRSSSHRRTEHPQIRTALGE